MSRKFGLLHVGDKLITPLSVLELRPQRMMVVEHEDHIATVGQHVQIFGPTPTKGSGAPQERHGTMYLIAAELNRPVGVDDGSN